MRLGSGGYGIVGVAKHSIGSLRQGIDIPGGAVAPQAGGVLRGDADDAIVIRAVVETAARLAMRGAPSYPAAIRTYLIDNEVTDKSLG